MARHGLFECSSPGLTSMKWMVILFNVLLWVSWQATCGVAVPAALCSSQPSPLQAMGVSLMAVGIWFYVTNNEYAVISRGQFLVGSVLMMTGGFGVIILGFLGATGAIFESAFVLIVVSARARGGCEGDMWE